MRRQNGKAKTDRWVGGGGGGGSFDNSEIHTKYLKKIYSFIIFANYFHLYDLETLQQF